MHAMKGRYGVKINTAVTEESLNRVNITLAIHEGDEARIKHIEIIGNTLFPTKVLIEDVRLKEDGDLILVRLVGSHFLWKMVRRIIGVLVEIGRGKLEEKDIKYFLEHNSPTPAKYTAPPSGLFLEKVVYDRETHSKELKAIIEVPAKERLRAE